MKYYLLTAALLAAVFLAAAGCSESNPLAPPTEKETIADYTGGEPVRFAARVETADQNRRMLTFAGRPDTVIAAHECIIVRLKGNEEAPVPFSGIKPSDSVRVQGVREQNGYVYAYRLQICQDTCWDTAFRDTIVSIDYAAGSFTVAGRTETILVDDNTYIWGNTIVRQAKEGNRYEFRHMVAQSASEGNLYRYVRRDTALALTDLQVGDVVEVRAKSIDANTLLAVFIKLVNCTDFGDRCIQFEAPIASIDLDTRTVTFEGLDWMGIVCNGAKLLDANGDPITLADFAVGDLVAVKGYPLEDGTLKICQMQKL